MFMIQTVLSIDSQRILFSKLAKGMGLGALGRQIKLTQ
jgi:hypothetical protein